MKPILSCKMTRTELWERPCSMPTWSKRRTQLHISGRDAGDTRFGAGGGLVGAESTSGVAGSGFPPPQETSKNARRSPNILKREKVEFILLFMITV